MPKMLIQNQHHRVMKTMTPGMVVNFNKNGSRLLVATDEIFYIFDASEGTYDLINSIEFRVVNQFERFISDMQISPDGDLFAYSATPSYSLHMRSLYDEEFKIALGYFNDVLEIRAEPFITSVRFSPCGKFLLCGGCEYVGCIYVFDLEAGIQKVRMKTYFDRDSDINVAEYIGNSPNIFVTGDQKGLIYLWDLRCEDKYHEQPVSVYRGHSSSISYIDSLHDDTYILSSSSKTINIYDLRRPSTKYGLCEPEKRSDNLIDMTYYNQNMRKNNSIMMHINDRFLSGEIKAKYSPIEQAGQRYIYSGCESGRIKIYDVSTGKVETILKGPRSVITDATWHPIRNEIVATSEDSYVNLYTYKKTDFVLKRSINGVDNSPNEEPLRRSRRIADRNS